LPTSTPSWTRFWRNSQRWRARSRRVRDRSRRSPGRRRAKSITAIRCLCFCGLQWRAIGQLGDIPFGTLFILFTRWTRLGLWRRLLDRLCQTWRLACGDIAEPSAVVIDSPLSLSASGQLSGGHRHVNLVGWREVFGWGMVAG
jgi:hypothetical protein